MPKPAKDESNPAKKTRTSQQEIPIYSVRSSLRIAQAIWDNFAGRGAAPHQIAMALDVSPTSGGWRNLCGSSIAYGLTEGGYNANEITLTELGKRIVAPTEEGDDVAAIVEAALRPRVANDFFRRYDKAKFPKAEIGQNVLVSMGIPKERAASAFSLLTENGQAVGVIQDTKTGPFVAIGTPTPAQPLQGGDDAVVEDSPHDQAPALFADGNSAHAAPAEQEAHRPETPGPKQIFVAHGKNHKPLEDLKKILDQFKIPYKVAVDEPNVGRPISKKVAQLMRECSAGIFIFTGDEKFQDGEGNEIHRPSENVVFELGAASVLWENKIIILKQKDVTFPSDYKDLGYIEFDETGLSNRALDLLKELVGLDFVRVQAA